MVWDRWWGGPEAAWVQGRRRGAGSVAFRERVVEAFRGRWRWGGGVDIEVRNAGVEGLRGRGTRTREASLRCSSFVIRHGSEHHTNVMALYIIVGQVKKISCVGVDPTNNAMHVYHGESICQCEMPIGDANAFSNHKRAFTCNEIHTGPSMASNRKCATTFDFQIWLDHKGPVGNRQICS
jgi:hypothetical protein